MSLHWGFKKVGKEAVSLIIRMVTIVLGIIFIIIGILGIPLPVFPGFIFIFLGASLLGIPLISKIRSLWRRIKRKVHF